MFRLRTCRVVGFSILRVSVMSPESEGPLFSDGDPLQNSSELLGCYEETLNP